MPLLSTHTVNNMYVALIIHYWYHLLTFLLLVIDCEGLKAGIELMLECGYPQIHWFITQNSYWDITSHLALGQALIRKMHINITLPSQLVPCLWFFSLKKWNRIRHNKDGWLHPGLDPNSIHIFGSGSQSTLKTYLERQNLSSESVRLFWEIWWAEEKGEKLQKGNAIAYFLHKERQAGSMKQCCPWHHQTDDYF